MLKKTLAALALGSALFTAGQAMAADYKATTRGAATVPASKAAPP